MITFFNNIIFFSRHVTGNELLVSGRHIFNHFNDCKDCNTYLCPEMINCIILLDVIKVCNRYLVKSVIRFLKHTTNILNLKLLIDTINMF